MGRGSSALAPWESLTPAPPASLFGVRLGRRVFFDRLARRVVTLGGFAVIASILAILFVLFAEVRPLLEPARAVSRGPADLGAQPLAIGVDEYRKFAYGVTASGIRFVPLDDPSPVRQEALPALDGATVVGTSALGRGPFALGLSDGRAVPVEVDFRVTFQEDRRTIEPVTVFGDPFVIDPAREPITRIAHVRTNQGTITAALVGSHELMIVATRIREALIGDSTREDFRHEVSLPVSSKATTLVMDDRGENVFVGTSSGHLLRMKLGDTPTSAAAEAAMPVNESGAAVTAIGLLNGDRTLIAGDAAGRVTSWQVLPDGESKPRLTRIYEFQSHDGPILSISPSARHKGFFTADPSGLVQFHYGTTGETLLSVATESRSLASVSFAPKADGFVAVDTAGRIRHWDLEAPHPEVTWRSLFGKVWYEGYERPETVWQSTGGTDDFEPKLSLTPLIYGTLKGTFYALVIAVPLALCGALYASQFMHPTFRAVVKPTVEIMAALPSVVLGFIAGLWLAPMVQDVVPGLALIPIVMPALVLLSLVLWQRLGRLIGRRFQSGIEIFILIPVVLAAIWLSLELGSVLERGLLSGDYRAWLLQTVGLGYDQRNSLVVGMAMGFAVVPIIFTIAEDSLSSVPSHLVAGSLALGATPWQTAIRTVLPTASPGIFSAVMIGFGRAVGETMIVLMATGNTPVMNASIFSGFRALSANIAVELPEAPYGGTLYRVLFVAALLLFFSTFLVNTLAELVRLRLRQRYRSL